MSKEIEETADQIDLELFRLVNRVESMVDTMRPSQLQRSWETIAHDLRVVRNRVRVHMNPKRREETQT